MVIWVLFWQKLTSCHVMQALEDDEMMRRYATLLARQDTARDDALKALQARTPMRGEVAGHMVPHHPPPPPPPALRLTPECMCTCDSTQYDKQVMHMYTHICMYIRSLSTQQSVVNLTHVPVTKNPTWHTCHT